MTGRARTICQVHDEIIKVSDAIQQDTTRFDLDKMSPDEMYEMLDGINSKMYDISHLTEEAKEYGEKMEERLRAYRESIEDLGFTKTR